MSQYLDFYNYYVKKVPLFLPYIKLTKKLKSFTHVIEAKKMWQIYQNCKITR